MPAIGPQTVAAAHAAGLAGIGVEAGRSLILDYETVRAQRGSARPFRHRPAGRSAMSGAGSRCAIAIVAGEESGDLLGADLVRALRPMSGRPIESSASADTICEGQGLKSLFDPAEIALMGFSAIVRDLPRLIRRIGETARAIAAARPDCLVTIDSPEFGLRVARKVRAAAPAIPIVHYVCPSVWAWRPSRAPAMRRMSIMCFACCRSSRPSSSASMARPAPSSATG